jgi:uncharacterized protein with von Willebrand factor type A (vWA) domain
MPNRARSLSFVASILLLLSSCAMCAAQENKKLAYGILIDNTGSMRTQFEMVKGLGKTIVHQVHDHATISVFSFESEGIGRTSRARPTPKLEHSPDEELLDQTIDSIYVQGGQTTLLDAIEFIAQRLSQQTPETNKVIVLVTDGEDRVSESDQKEVIWKLKQLKIVVYAIGLVQKLDSGKRSKAQDLLKLITKETGGRVVFPKSDSVDVQSLLSELALPIQ